MTINLLKKKKKAFDVLIWKELWKKLQVKPGLGYNLQTYMVPEWYLILSAHGYSVIKNK